jgi:hypothetical protein
LEPPGFGLQIVIGFIHADHHSAEVEIYGGPSGCCYSADADRTIYLDVEQGLLRIPIYVGKKRKRNEFVRNERFGTLYLRFSKLR